MTKVLLLPSSDYLGHPFPQRYNQIFERLNSYKNIEVHIFNFNMYNAHKLKTNTIIHDIEGVNINNSGLYYLINGLKHAIELRKLIIRENIDVLVFSNLLVPLIHNLFDTIKNLDIPIIFDTPDYYPTSATGYLASVDSNIGSFIEGTFEIMFRFLLRKSAVVTVASKSLEVYARNLGCNNVVYIPNGISKDFFKIHDGRQIRRQIGVDESDVLVGYIGSIEFWLDIEPLLKGIALSVKDDLPIKLFLVGKSLHTNYSEYVKRCIKKYNLETYVYWHEDFIEYDKVPQYMSSLDIGTIPFDVSNMTSYYSSPNKLWEYASQKVSIFSTSIPEVRNYNNCVTITDSAYQYYQALKEYTLNEGGVFEQKKNIARNLSLTKNWDNSAKMMSDIICSLL